MQRPRLHGRDDEQRDQRFVELLVERRGRAGDLTDCNLDVTNNGVVCRVCNPTPSKVSGLP